MTSINRKPALILLAVSAALGASATAATAATTPTPTADLATVITTLPTAQVTGYQYFHVTVTNNGPSPASNVVITGGMPPRSTFHCVTGDGAACGSVVPGVTCKPPTTTAPLTCTIASLTAESSVSVWMGFYHGFFFPAQGYCDSASATSTTTPDPNTANNTAVVCARVV
jgi:uncharacterized repeat protein (TIGR01451 family)